jgi:hypothetical protein
MHIPDGMPADSTRENHSDGDASQRAQSVHESIKVLK